MFMCKDHWRRLPKRYRDAVWAAYVEGQEVRKDPTPEYLDAARQAIDWIEQHGGSLA
jgi:TRAP-type C4-dicarboxylate transport system substrate-binding protein